jgi:hypothetical protein
MIQATDSRGGVVLQLSMQTHWWLCLKLSTSVIQKAAHVDRGTPSLAESLPGSSFKLSHVLDGFMHKLQSVRKAQVQVQGEVLNATYLVYGSEDAWYYF